jgi:hypothetical protein
VHEKPKPAGIVLIALCSGLSGLAAIPIGCTAAFLGGLPGGGAFSLVGALVFALGVLLLASAYGLWTLQPWGRTYTWWLYLACIPLGLMAIFGVLPGQTMSTANTILQLVGIAIEIVVLVYLSKPEVAGLFESAEGQGSYPEFVRREPHLSKLEVVGLFENAEVVRREPH